MFNERENADFIKNHTRSDITLPEGLSRESIEGLIKKSIPEKKKKKGTIIRFVAAGVAACIAITGVSLISDRNFSRPEKTDNIHGISQSEDNSNRNYDDILSHIKTYAESYSDKKYELYYGASDDSDEPIVFNSVADSEGFFSNSESEESSSQYGTTNLREEGVSEADVLITDGEYLYFIDSDEAVRIVRAEKDGSFTLTSRIYPAEKTENGNYTVTHDIYIYKNLLFINYTKYDPEKPVASFGISGCEIYDISTRTSPVLIKEIKSDGEFVSSRITDEKLIVITKYDITSFYGTEDESSLLPACYNGSKRTVLEPDCIYFSLTEIPESYVTVSVTDLSTKEMETVSSSHLGAAYETYCTRDTLYIISPEIGTRTVGIRFAYPSSSVITAYDISTLTPQLIAETKVDGNVINSFAIDEYNGYLRLALNKGNVTSVIILTTELEKVSAIDDIAPTETIRSARFMGDTLYLVTFRQTDPLFVIDLSEPEKPEITGELKIPGFSEYLHPVGDKLLVGIGKGGTQEGTDGSAKISLFDVSDPKNPVEADSIIIPDCTISSDPKAFMSIDKESFLVPFDRCDRNGNFILADSTLISESAVLSGALQIDIENGRLILKNQYIASSSVCFSAGQRVNFIDSVVYIYTRASGLASFERESGEFICSYHEGFTREFSDADTKELLTAE